jgi:hypothetical protein
MKGRAVPVQGPRNLLQLHRVVLRLSAVFGGGLRRRVLLQDL